MFPRVWQRNDICHKKKVEILAKNQIIHQTHYNDPKKKINSRQDHDLLVMRANPLPHVSQLKQALLITRVTKSHKQQRDEEGQ